MNQFVMRRRAFKHRLSNAVCNSPVALPQHCAFVGHSTKIIHRRITDDFNTPRLRIYLYFTRVTSLHTRDIRWNCCRSRVFQSTVHPAALDFRSRDRGRLAPVPRVQQFPRAFIGVGNARNVAKAPLRPYPVAHSTHYKPISSCIRYEI